MSYVAGGREMRPSASRSSIWISVWLRSCASTTRLRASGWADMEGGARRRVRAPVLAGTWVGVENSKSEDSSIVKEGDIFCGISEVKCEVCSGEKSCYCQWISNDRKT